MAVRCAGDIAVMEQLGERQDFESELTRRGFRHEDFELYVRRAKPLGKSAAWTTNYAVRVSNDVTGRQNIYWGGPKERWVAQFTQDLAQGMYGAPVYMRARRPFVTLVNSDGAG